MGLYAEVITILNVEPLPVKLMDCQSIRKERNRLFGKLTSFRRSFVVASQQRGLVPHGLA